MADKSKKSVLFVCLGNICRSTMAEIVFRAMVVERGLMDEWYIDSAGTSNYHIGDTPDHRTVEVCNQLLESTISKQAHQHFKSIPLHRGRQFTEADMENFDFVFAMDDSNLSNMKKVVHHSRNKSNHKATMKRLGEYNTAKKLNVEDPYYGNMSTFRECYNHVFDCLQNFLKEQEQQQ
ncbi:hypothetical protein CYY_005787 [Polysphondylium violaceum]|uniref:Phosphotyrosine protein phosphatase I domain-containing protein n=1 Tax=Polysphondylium violaceum TaxID=133409 RepID=A0A8J4PSX5_9MYCE|nr:hypothetical protein CYY_005787 [Polysphondylium violaceum]